MQTIIYKALFSLAIISFCSCSPTPKESTAPPSNTESEVSDSRVDYSANAGTYTYAWQGSRESMSEDFGVPNSGGCSVTIDQIDSNRFRCCVRLWESYSACEDQTFGIGTFENIRQGKVQFDDVYGESGSAVLEFLGDSIIVKESNVGFLLCPQGNLNDVVYRSDYSPCE